MNLTNQPAHCFSSKYSNFAEYGYEVYAGDKNLLKDLKNTFTEYMRANLSKFLGKEIDKQLFTLEKYHTFVNDETHHDFVKSTGRDISMLINENNNYLKLVLETANIEFDGFSRIYNSKIEYRVCRPNKPDNNLPHRDHWFPYFKNLVNIYIPLAGSNCMSAMPVVPMSHLWTDEDVTPLIEYNAGKYVNPITNVAYSVSPIKESKKEIYLHRPDLFDGGFMLFSPMCVHGGGSNGSRVTRFSFEIRLELLKK